MEANCGLTRFRIYFLKSGTSVSFLAWIGDNKISVYRNEAEDELYSLPTIVQHGDLSDLIYVMQSGEIGSVIILWIVVLLIFFVLIYTSAYAEEEEETPTPSNKSKNKKKKKKRKKRS